MAEENGQAGYPTTLGDEGADAAVASAMLDLAEGRISDFVARDEELGMTVTVVAKDRDRYNVRRTLDKPSHLNGWDNVRDDWRSGRWIRMNLLTGHWSLQPPADEAS